MTTITTKSKKVFSYLFLSLLLASLLYSFEFVQNFSDSYTIAEKQFLKLKKENKESLKKLKENSVNSEFYLPYIENNRRYKESIKSFEKVKQSEKIFLFKNTKVFLYELLPILALLIYFIFNLYRSFKKESKNIGIKMIHSVFIMYAFFKLFWIFQQFQDFAKPVYYLITAISAYLVGLAVYLIHKQEVSAFQRLRKKLITISYYAIKNTKGEQKEEMLSIINKTAKD